MKYLGVLLDENMSWNEQIYQIKLSGTIGILSKLRSHVNLNTLKIAYYCLSIPMGPEKSRNQNNNAETPKLCSQKN